MSKERTVIWHNPRCSKSRQTLALLESNGIAPVIVEYLKSAPSEADIRDALKLLSMESIELIRKGESIFKEASLSNQSSDEALIRAMAQNPVLIERPIVFHNGKAALGRPPGNVFGIL